MSDSLFEERLRKLQELAEMGHDPYGWRFPDVVANDAIRAQAEAANIEAGEKKEDLKVRAAGRIVLRRVMGSLAFLTIRDSTGDMQIGLSKRDVGSEGWQVIKRLDLGDIAGFDGVVGRTKTNEITVWSDAITVLCKSLHQPPEKYHGLTDVDQRYRQRYVDLFTNAEVMQTFRQRSQIIDAVRQVMRDRGFMEVETPMLQPIYGGAAARPFTTHHNTLDMDLFLRISPELYLKRLLVGGMERVFEINRNFRNEGISPRHNPEFTMMECYQAYGDLSDMMDIVEAMFAASIEAIGGGTKRTFKDLEIDFATPWARKTYTELLKEHAGVDLADINAVRAKAKQFGIDMPKADDAVVANKLFEETVEDKLIQPTFVTEYPAAICPLTRRKKDDPSLALRFEAFVAGMEMGNAYTELNDPAIQKENFEAQVTGEGDETMRVMDEDFINALEYGMPPAGGLGVGIDRMVMMLTNSPSIRDVILFPLQRPQSKD